MNSSGMLATGKHCIMYPLRGAPRPAAQCYHFAGNCGESALPAARAINERPCIHAITLYA